MGKNGNGYNGHYTAQQFIDAIPGTGGIISVIAEKVGCAWNTARKYIDNYPTVKTAYENERNRITDVAKHNIINAIVDDADLQLSKWWLTVKDVEFTPIERREVMHSGEQRIVLTWGDRESDDGE